jgi:deoxyribonuclease-4
MVLETPWIGKDSKKQRPMYEAEIAWLRGDAERRFGDEYMAHLEELDHFLRRREAGTRDFVLQTWELLKSDAKARKADPREPMERIFDMVVEERLFPELNEEQINHRITGWFAYSMLNKR